MRQSVTLEPLYHFENRDSRERIADMHAADKVRADKKAAVANEVENMYVAPELEVPVADEKSVVEGEIKKV